MKNEKNSNIAFKLTCAALTLPGLIQTANAGRVEETYNADFQYGNYQEGSGRMGVDIYEAALSTPIGKNMTASVNIVEDIIGGASPIYNTREPNGKITQVLSGASGAALTSECGYSICEKRDAASAALTYFFDTASLNIGGGYSREHDYSSKYFNTAASLDFNKKLTTLNFGASVAFDEIQPTFTSWTNLPDGFKAHKTSMQYLLGVSQVIDKDSLIQSNITFGYHKGYLTDPYKQVTFHGDLYLDGFLMAPDFDTTLSEKRPRERFEWAWLTQYVRHFDQFNNAALHADYRFSTNDWGINAHTVEFSWHQPIADGWQIIPRFRYYSQDRADFYQPIANSDLNASFDSNFNFILSPKNLKSYSSDYRLAGFGTVSGGLKVSKEINNLEPINQLKLQAGFEYYAHKSEFELGGNGKERFNDFGYYLITAGFNLKF
ncbi:MAG: DUF3570 domain-containing protein [Methylococcaceae bacterium]|nr:DUF3570 domain-containing protein [Methylococcaceae bacterium]